MQTVKSFKCSVLFQNYQDQVPILTYKRSKKKKKKKNPKPSNTAK